MFPQRSFVLILAVCLLLAVLADVASAADWLRFRGPNGSGISAEQQSAPVTWSPTQNLKWKVALPGSGVSCPIVVGDRVFVTCYSGYGEDRRNPGRTEDLKRHLLCVDRGTGNVVWQKTIDAVQPEDPFSGPGVPEHGYASHTPVSDGENVYVFFGKSGVYAFDFQGAQLWHAAVGSGSDPRRWGSSSSPIIVEDLLVVPAGAEDRAVIGLDRKTGKELWRADSDILGNVWGTPGVVETGDGQKEIVIGAPNEIWALNPANGKLRWYCEAMETDQFNSSVVISDGVVYAVEGRGGGSIAVRAGGRGDVTESNVIWTGRDSSRFGSPVIADNRLYYVGNRVMNCIDSTTGERLSQIRLQSGSSDAGDAERERTPGSEAGGQQRGGGGGQRGQAPGGGRGGGGGRGNDYSSLVLADGKLYFTARDGEVFVIEADEQLRQLAANRMTEDAEDFAATPAVSNGELFFRSNRHLYCISADPTR